MTEVVMKDQRARVRKVLGCATTVAVSAAILAGSGAADAAPRAGLVDVMLIGNSAAGTVSFLDQNSFAVLGSVNVIPDLQQRLDEMNLVERFGVWVSRRACPEAMCDGTGGSFRRRRCRPHWSES
jgi:hypothetical protein